MTKKLPLIHMSHKSYLPLYIFIGITVLVLGFSLVKSTNDPIFSLIDVQEANKLIDDNVDLIVIDVRTPKEVEQGYIPGTDTFLNFYDDSFNESLAALDKNTPYLVYCRSGNRSSQTIEKMKRLGFTEVYDVDGGKQAWQQAEKALITASTNKHINLSFDLPNNAVYSEIESTNEVFFFDVFESVDNVKNYFKDNGYNITPSSKKDFWQFNNDKEIVEFGPNRLCPAKTELLVGRE